MIHRVVSTATTTSTPREYRTNNIHPQFALFQIYKMTDFGAPLIRGDIIMGFENFYSACAVNISFTQPKKKKNSSLVWKKSTINGLQCGKVQELHA